MGSQEIALGLAINSCSRIQMLVKGKRQTQTNGVQVLTPCILWTLRYQTRGTHGVYLGSLRLIPITV